MRMSQCVWCAHLDAPITPDDCRMYGCRFLFCLPVSKDLEFGCVYLALFSAPRNLFYCTDSVFKFLGDLFRRKRMGNGHVLSITCVAEYFDDEPEGVAVNVV